MSNPVPVCTHIKTDGTRCGSPAVAGTELCYHHSAVKTALGKVPARTGAGSGEFAPIPFVFPEDRASMQINFFLLLQAFNEGRIDLRRYRAMLSMLKSMAANLGKAGSLVEEQRDQGSGTRDQKNSEPTTQKRDAGRPQQTTGNRDEEGEDPFADLRHLPEPEFYAAARERTRKRFEAECAAEKQARAASDSLPAAS